VAASAGRAYLLDRPRGENRERVACLDADSGEELWGHNYPADYSRLPAAGPDAGPLATPTVHDGRLYTVGALGRLTCLDLSGPTVAWEYDLVKEFDAELPPWGLACSPLIVGDLVIVQPGGRRGSVAAFDRRTGEQRWTALQDVNGYCSPILADCAGVRQVMALSQGRLVGLHPETGAYLWHYAWRESTSQPLVQGDYAFITCDHGCAMVKLESGGGAVHARRVFECGGKLLASHNSTPVWKDGYIFGFHGDVHRAKLTCVDARDPTRPRWRTDEVAAGHLLRFGDLLLVQTQDGDLLLIEATPDDYSPLAELRGVLARGKAWTPPSAVGNRLLLRDREKVVCVRLPTVSQ
jgi:hypothetical protein